MGRLKALLLSLGHFIAYTITLKSATSFAYSQFTVNLPNYDWFVLAMVAFGVSIFAFFQYTDVKHSRAFGGFFKNLLTGLYAYLAVIMASHVVVGFGELAFEILLNWGLWIYVIVFPSVLNGLIYLLKPYTEED